VNAIEIIEQVRAHDAELVVENDRLLVRGRVDPLPEDLRRALRDHKVELMVALGVPPNRTVASVLKEVRPHLPKTLRELPDDRLLVLVNWSIITSFEKAVREAGRGREGPSEISGGSPHGDRRAAALKRPRKMAGGYPREVGGGR
jgi:hypothetical protein